MKEVLSDKIVFFYIYSFLKVKFIYSFIIGLWGFLLFYSFVKIGYE